MPKLNLDQDFILPVLSNRSGFFFTETEFAHATMADQVASFLAGNLEGLEAVIRFNPIEHTSIEVTEDFAQAAYDQLTAKGLTVGKEAADFIADLLSLPDRARYEMQGMSDSEIDDLDQASAADHRNALRREAV